MIRYEAMRLLRNPAWKYGILALLAAYMAGTAILTQLGEDSSALILFWPVSQTDVHYVLPALYVFAILTVFYEIMWKEEPFSSWATFLSFPLTCRTAFVSKLIVLLICQLPVFLLGLLVSWLFFAALSSGLFIYLAMIQLLYLTGMLFGCYHTSQGYLAQMGTITIINVTKRLVPIFVLFTILNAHDWVGVMLQLCFFIILFCASVLFYLFCRLPNVMKRKLYRELVLGKLFPSLRLQPTAMEMERYRKRMDTILQKGFQYGAVQRPSHWRRCAIIEVVMKLHFFAFLISMVLLLFGLLYQKAIFFLLFLVSLAYLVVCIWQVIQKIYAMKR